MGGGRSERYTYVSDSVETMLGYTPSDLIGKTPFDLMAPERRSGWQRRSKHRESKRPFANLENVVL
jgi:PAS domain S-box-containing protein